MHSALDALFDIVIGVIVFSMCIGFFLTVANHLLGAPDMGFGRLEDKAQIGSAQEYNQYERFSCVNWYQMATVPLVNDYSADFYTYAAVATSSEDVKDWGNKFTQQYWFHAPDIYSGGSIAEIDPNKRMMPKKAFEDGAVSTLFTIGGDWDEEITGNNKLYPLFLYSTNGHTA